MCLRRRAECTCSSNSEGLFTGEENRKEVGLLETYMVVCIINVLAVLKYKHAKRTLLDLYCEYSNHLEIGMYRPTISV